ncbi:EspA/EspE family type VII secretion system effector [Micromonospora sp. WMMD737]|uniref:EspA/EspE family type VII secretion system effector n=1 Tax=Micromonospora sp. WMMD737 TaxID=3404113 RepID=UPI003B93FBC8
MRVDDGIGGSGKVTGGPFSAGSTTLDAGLLAITGMRRTLGAGDPERGAGLELGARGLTEAADAMAAATPGVDWAGAGARAYSLANRQHYRRTASMAALDRAARRVLDRQGDQIVSIRTRLDGVSEHLAGLRHTARALAATPGVGQAMRAQFELATVTAALGAAGDDFQDLTVRMSENTTELQGIASRYSALAEAAGGPAEPGPWQDPGLDRWAPRADDDDPDEDLHEDPGAAGLWPAPPSAAGLPTSDEPAPPSEMAAPGAAPQAGALPVDAMSGLTAAFGAVGGMIGSAVTPLAAVLSGVTAMAAESLPALSGAADDADDADVESPPEEPLDDLRDEHRQSKRDDAETAESAESPEAAESDTVDAPGVPSAPAPQPPAEAEAEAVPPAPIRPPQQRSAGDSP